MIKVEVFFPSYCTEEHNECVKNLLSLLGCKEVSILAESVVYEVPENVFHIINDMTVCDYIMTATLTN